MVSDEEEQERIERQWDEFDLDVPLEIVYSPYRELTRPVMRFIDELDARYENDIDHGAAPRVRGAPLVGQPAPQPERAAAQGPPAVPEGHGRHLACRTTWSETSGRPQRIDAAPNDWTDRRPSTPSVLSLRGQPRRPAEHPPGNEECVDPMISLAAEGGYQIFELGGTEWFWLIFSALPPRCSRSPSASR